jgi:expansin
VHYDSIVPRVFTLFATLPLVALACSEDDAEERAREEAQSHPLSTTVRDGIATFYDADGSGNCSFDKTPSDLDVAALAIPEFDRSASCGGCLRVHGPNATITVRIVDSCPPCSKNKVNLDLSESAFAKIGDPDEGRIPIRYQLVSCVTSGNVRYHFKDGSSKYWTAIQVRNHKVPIAKVEYRSAAGAYVALKRETYNYFIASDGVGDQPKGLALRVTATDGQVIEDTLAGGVQDDETVTGTKQFQ